MTDRVLTPPTDEQAADAALSCLPDDFEVTVARSWFRPHEEFGMPADRIGRSEWVSRHDHAAAILALGRAVLRLRAERDLLRAEIDAWREWDWSGGLDEPGRISAEEKVRAARAATDAFDKEGS